VCVCVSCEIYSIPRINLRLLLRSEAVWHVHVNASQHKENLAVAKELKSKLQMKQTQKKEDRVAGIKRTIEEMRSEVPEKKLKGILKTSASTAAVTTILVPKQESQKAEQDQAAASKNNSIPDDFFDSSSSSKSKKSSGEKQQQTEEKMDVDSAIPEGFFDDPVKDAKARNLEYKNPDEEEWAKFQKEIKDADVESKNIINEDFEEATAERQIDEIDEQMRNWSRYDVHFFFSLPHEY
jgi:zinc finger protein 830